MKVKNRLLRCYLVLAAAASLFLIGATSVSALAKNITVADVTVKEKSGTITVVDPTVSDNEISSNVTFNKKDDFVTFELSLKNNESEKYKIESIGDNNTNENIQTEYFFSEDFIGTGEIGKATIKLTYKNALINVDKISLNDLEIKIYLVNEDGKSDEIIINPTTSDSLPLYLVMFAVASIVLVIVLKKRNIRGIKVCGILFALSLLFIPLATLAKEKYEVQIKFTNIDIIGEFETYDITIYPGNGEAATTVQVKYGEKLTNLPADPSKDGYDFEKWVDGNGNTVTTDTVITGPITVEAKYTAKKYNITYDLNGGSLPDGKTNPTEYTIEDEITVNNPAKLGYTFIGWSGTGIDGKTTNLVIPTGSKDARSYVANYSANENTPYMVTHRYQNLNDLTTYTEVDVTEYGETDKTIPAPRQARTGFETPAVQNVKVSGDGSSHITYTYDRETYSYSVTDRTYITSDSTSDGSYPYETSITVKAQERDGYTFAWDDGDTNYERTFELTEATSLTPVYTAKTNTPYVVKHYKQKLTLDGYEIADTQNLTGTTDAPISPAVNSYTGFTSPAVQHTTIAGNGSTEVIYNYDREMYAFSFNDNENVTSTKPADSYPYGTVITLTANEVAGKTFSKWSNNETANPLTITLTGDLTIEPVYTDSTVTVTFDTNGGSEVASQSVLPGGKATRPAEDPTKFNQLFYNWYTTDSYETLFDFNTTTITADTTVYARFVPSAFPKVFEQEGECIFNGSEGVLEGENCAYANGENKFINTGVQLYTAENHDKDYEIGFTIKSYDYLENVTQATFMNTKLEGNNYPGLVFRQFDDKDELDLSARKTETYNVRKKWANEDKERVVKIYRIRNKTTKVQEIFYSMDGGKKTQLTNLSHFNPVFDTSVWFGAAPVDTSANTAQRILVGTLSNMYIKLGTYEEPEGVTYTVEFDANGGSVSPSSITKDKGDAIDELPTPTDIPAGKTFDGWYTDLGEEGVKVESPYMPNTNKTLYAKYDGVPMLTVSFDTDGGSSVDSQDVLYGGKATRPSTDPTKEGYIFDDWYTTDSYNAVFDFGNTSIYENTTIYGKFDVNPCKTFSTDSWATIRDNLESDPNYYAIGCEKEVNIDMDDDSVTESYTVRLANTSTPEVCSNEGYSQTACGMVIEFVDIVGEGAMNPTQTNEGGWKASNMATYLNSDFFNKLPTGLQSVIIPTYPIVSGFGKNHSSPDITSEDAAINKIYLLSSREAGLNATNDNKNNETTDTRVLDYYVGTSPDGDEIKRVKKNINNQENFWWLRSASSNWDNSFHAILFDDGYHSGYYGRLVNMVAYSYMIGISPAFRIGTMPEFTVSFDTDGGSDVASQTISYGNNATRPSSDPTKEGYVFDDWYTSGAHDTLFDFGNTKITDNTTIYANFVDPCRDFSTASWSTIRDNLESNPNYYAVGCEKEVNIDMDDDSVTESYTVRLANSSTPEECSAEEHSQTVCGTVIEFVDLVGIRQIHYLSSNNGGWKSTQMATWLNSDFFDKLPSDLRSVIIPTYPIVSGSGSGGNSPDITADDADKNKIYLLSLREFGISSTYDNKRTYTHTLDYYTNFTGVSYRVKYYQGIAKGWWLRSASSQYDNRYWAIGDDGYAWETFHDSPYAGGVAPAFRIGIMPEFTVSFDTDGGSDVASQTIVYGSKATRPTTDPTKESYIFDDWYTTDSYDTVFDFDNTVITGDTTIYAKWGEPSRKATDIIASQANNLGDYTIDFTKKAIISDDISTANGNGVNKYTENGSDVYYFRGQVDNNNVIWADICWKIVRTTATGGVKMIYNGEPTTVGTAKQCNATDTATQINAAYYYFNLDYVSPADMGYMYGTRISRATLYPGSTVFTFSNNVSKNGNTYTLDTSTGQSISGTWADERTNAAVRYHYFCTDGATSCDNTKIGYIFNFRLGDIYYLPVNGYTDIEAMKDAMFTNTNDSVAKSTIESWFETKNLDGHVSGTKNYEDDLEDAVFCNDRSYYSGALKGKDSDATPSGSTLYSYHGAYGRNQITTNGNYTPSLDCANSRDAFQVSNNNAKLNHKIGLATADELTLAGMSQTSTENYLYTGLRAWSASPGYFQVMPFNFFWGSYLNVSSLGTNGLRPLVSLKSGIEFTSGTGTTADPYIVE